MDPGGRRDVVFLEYCSWDGPSARLIAREIVRVRNIGEWGCLDAMGIYPGCLRDSEPLLGTRTGAVIPEGKGSSYKHLATVRSRG